MEYTKGAQNSSDLESELDNFHLSRPPKCSNSRSVRSKSASGPKLAKDKQNANGMCGHGVCKEHTWRPESRELPTCTSEWDIVDLESVGVYYVDKPVTLEQLFDLVYDQTEMFACLSSQQLVLLNTLRNTFTFSFSIYELLVYSGQNYLDGALLESLKRDVQESSRTPLNLAENFTRNTVLMIQYYEYTNEKNMRDYGRKTAAEAVFIDLFTIFVRMCGLLASPGIQWKSTMNILQHSVKSESDVVILAGNILDIPTTVSVVSVVDVKPMDKFMNLSQDTDKKLKKTSPKRTNAASSRSEASSSEKSQAFSEETGQTDSVEEVVREEKYIYKRIPKRVLAQHGGELIVLSPAYKNFFNKDKKKKFIPGIIVIGTQITFTLLEYNFDHMKEVILNNVIENGRSYIYYTEPKDFLKKEDRDLLLEMFLRLNNIKQ